MDWRRTSDILVTFSVILLVCLDHNKLLLISQQTTKKYVFATYLSNSVFVIDYQNNIKHSIVIKT